MTNILSWIETREKEIKEQNKQIEVLKKIQKLIPDLTYTIDRWKKFRLHSPTVNAKAESVDIRHSCGCCGDSPLLARPFIIVEDEQIFTVPESFSVGEKGYGEGDIPYPGWRTKLMAAGLPENIINQVETYFESHKPCEEQEDSL